MQGSQTNMISAPGSVGRSPLAGRRLGSVTHGQSPGLTAPSDLQPHSRRLRRSAFTLTELLVVIAIIAVLAALSTAAVLRAMTTAKRARVILEVKGVTSAIEDLKSELGAYPPSGMNDGSTAMVQAIQSDFERMAKKAFPRINPQEFELFKALAGTSANYSTTIVTDSTLDNGLRGDEALYFWLGGFSQDPQYPLSGPGGPSYLVADGEVLENRQPRYEFNLSNLIPRNDDGDLDYDNVRYIEYTVSVNGSPAQERRINLWAFTPNGSPQPLVYFDASRRKPSQYLVPAVVDADPNGSWIYPFIQLRQGAPASPKPNDFVFANRGKFQVVHCGLDEAWGSNYSGTASNPPLLLTQPDIDDQLWSVYPNGPFTGDTADNLTNFTDGEIADESEE
jgi:prepilin-type N-terminal cleavage/methylation domain-containing protein